MLAFDEDSFAGYHVVARFDDLRAPRANNRSDKRHCSHCFAARSLDSINTSRHTVDQVWGVCRVVALRMNFMLEPNTDDATIRQ